MSAIEAVETRLKQIAVHQEDCIKDGCVVDAMRYRYQLLEREKNDLAKSLDWMKSTGGLYHAKKG